MSPIGRRATAAAGLVLAAVVAAGCATGTLATTSPGTDLVTSVSASPTVASTPATPATPPPPGSSASPTLPPVASLTVEGGDPVAGELGAYTWDGAGSDGPWLAGAPVSLAAGEPIQVSLAGSPPVTTWRARIASASEGATPRSLATGPGPIRFAGPAPGDWTVELTVEVPGSGSATWYWELEVS